MTPGHIRFSGGETRFDIAVADVVSIETGIQRFPWGSLLFGLPIPPIAIAAVAAGAPADEVAGSVVTTALALAGVYVMNLTWSWVVVTWRDAHMRSEQSVYFRDGTARGFGGRTAEINALLTSHWRGELVLDAAGGTAGGV